MDTEYTNMLVSINTKYSFYVKAILWFGLRVEGYY